MSTYKRRIVYLSDAEWEQLTTIAKSNGTTISAAIRFMLFEPRWGEVNTRDEHMAPVPGEPSERNLAKLPGGGVQARQAQRDELLRKINRGK